MIDNKPNIKILVACHKADPNIRQDEIYMPIHVGKTLHPEFNLGFQGDDTGDNISEKNGSYCELTALYWAWKNLKDVDYIGLCHYRRYFDITDQQILNNLSAGKTIIPNEYISEVSNFSKLASFINLEEAYILIDTILEFCPNIRQDVIDYFFNSNKYSVFNMFITDWNTFNDYCEFLFPLLNAVKIRIRENNYNRQRRVLGYMGEALLGLWLEYKNIDTKKVAIITEKIRNINTKIRFRNLLRTLTFNANNFPKEKTIPVYEAVRVGLRADGIKLRNLE